MNKARQILILSLIILLGFPSVGSAQQDPTDAERRYLFDNVETLTGIPWYFLAAIDQYERSIQRARPDLPEKEGPIAITVPLDRWAGPLNPDSEDVIPESIHFFGGIGRDGNGDGKANPTDATDILYTMAEYLSRFGKTYDDLRIGLWNYYQHSTAVDVITHTAKVYQKFGTTELNEHRFPIPLQYNYTYHNTWGHRRGWGGLRIHEGTDIFAGYGTPVLSTCYGYVELKGWNRYGGWRIGIRDTNNNYHYYGHLGGFNKSIKQGDIVKPGTPLGFVGSSGYGPPGTAGKFPPHLHYGIYKFNGHTTFSFDPYPHLRAWEQKTREQMKKKKDTFSSLNR